MINLYKDYIGVFDSGIGGLSILKEIRKILPKENIIYVGDTKNAPYGNKSEEEVKRCVKNIVEDMVNNGVKAVVFACNTATSIAVKDIREEYKDMIIIGIEPAIKVAVDNNKQKILVLATTNTIKLDKYQKLIEKLDASDKIISVDLPGLSSLIDTGVLDSKEIEDILEEKLLQYKGNVDSIVLGCTHYPFVKDKIQKIINVPIYDGSVGTAKELKRRLTEENLLSDNEGLTIFKSTGEQLDYEKMYDQI